MFIYFESAQSRPIINMSAVKYVQKTGECQLTFEFNKNVKKVVNFPNHEVFRSEVNRMVLEMSGNYKRRAGDKK